MLSFLSIYPSAQETSVGSRGSMSIKIYFLMYFYELSNNKKIYLAYFSILVVLNLEAFLRSLGLKQMPKKDSLIPFTLNNEYSISL